MIQLPKDFTELTGSIANLDADALCRALDTPASVSIRYNRRKPMADDRRGALASVDGSVDWCRDGRYLAQRPLFTLDPMLHAGAYYVQDASSMIYRQVAEKIVEKMGNRQVDVLDFCAAPGGKTTAIINAVPDGSTIVANEFVAARGKILRENLEKWGYPNVITTGDASERYRGISDLFDIVAVDAPCSGEGMMRKEEEARRQWSEKLIEDCANLQRRILTDIVGTLRPGGFLIYSTCTFNLLENERNSLYIQNTLGLEPVSAAELGLEGVEKVGGALLPGVEALRFMPHLTRGEGLYLSVFRKPEIYNSELQGNALKEFDINGEPPVKRKKENRKAARYDKKSGKGPAAKYGSHAIELTAEMRNVLSDRLKPEVEPHFEVSGEMVTMLPQRSVTILESLRKNGVNVTGVGLPIAEIKTGKRPEVIPDSRLALNLAMRHGAFPEMDLDYETAIKYLRREAIYPDANIPAGFVVVKYEGIPLGLIKNLGNRANNLYPTAWKIRNSFNR